MKVVKNKTKAMLRIEHLKGMRIEEVLRTLYVDKHMSIPEMQKELGVSYITVFSWLKQAGIYSRGFQIGGEEE